MERDKTGSYTERQTQRHRHIDRETETLRLKHRDRMMRQRQQRKWFSLLTSSFVITGSQPPLHASAQVRTDRGTRSWRCDGRSAVRLSLCFLFLCFSSCGDCGLCVCTRVCCVCRCEQRVRQPSPLLLVFLSTSLFFSPLPSLLSCTSSSVSLSLSLSFFFFLCLALVLPFHKQLSSSFSLSLSLPSASAQSPPVSAPSLGPLLPSAPTIASPIPSVTSVVSPPVSNVNVATQSNTASPMLAPLSAVGRSHSGGNVSAAGKG